MKPEEFSERLWDFAARVGKVADSLPDTRLGAHVADQLIRSGTVPAPSYDAARSAEHRPDPALELHTATQGTRETLGWLRLATRAGLLPAIKLRELIDECEQLLQMLSQLAPPAQEACPPVEAPSPKPSAQALSAIPGVQGLDHIAIAVPDTEAALKVWRDQLGLTVLYSEDVNAGTVKLTHLDLGNAHLQLVQPLTPDHPLQAWLQERGPGLHHLCLAVADLTAAKKNAPVPTAPALHQGTQGKSALFLDKSATDGIQLELTGPLVKPPSDSAS